MAWPRCFCLLGILATVLTIVSAVSCSRQQTAQPVRVRLVPAEMPADGYSEAILTISSSLSGYLSVPHVSTRPNNVSVQRIERTSSGWRAYLRAGILPGVTNILVKEPTVPPVTVPLLLQLLANDRFRDGTPDFLRLDDPADQSTFRRWFTFLSEVQFFTSDTDRPAEIVDCSALLRYAYRETLHRHDAAWYRSLHLPFLPALSSIAKYAYPQTPLGAALFRLQAGSFAIPDCQNGVFGQFANAETLQKRNTFFVSRDIRRALPGDLLFYRRPSGHVPYHSMIYVGPSHISTTQTRYVVYHTGPDGTKTGEIRRRSVEELLNYPDTQWQPKWTNPYFLGVFRWNILRTNS